VVVGYVSWHESRVARRDFIWSSSAIFLLSSALIVVFSRNSNADTLCHSLIRAKEAAVDEPSEVAPILMPDTACLLTGVVFK
jgi:hypothetical protein